eukprot:6208511-Pleurochrysis_carterae.AAC.2
MHEQVGRTVVRSDARAAVRCRAPSPCAMRGARRRVDSRRFTSRIAHDARHNDTHECTVHSGEVAHSLKNLRAVSF